MRKFIRKFQRLFANSKADDFDLKYEVNTAGFVPRWQLFLFSRNAIHGVHYQPVGELELRAAIDFLKLDPKDFCFIDLGCGKGRALVIAERYGFRNIIGVEYNKKLTAIAASNTMRAKVICADAADFRFPDENLVLFLYNPFSAKVMAKVIDNLASHHRKLYILYCNPKCAELFNKLTPLRDIPEAPSFKAWVTGLSLGAVVVCPLQRYQSVSHSPAALASPWADRSGA